MSKKNKNNRKKLEKIGMLPGSLFYIGNKGGNPSSVSCINYSNEEFSERQVKKLDECLNFRFSNSISWINVEGIHDVELVESIGKHYGLHPLLLEDILNTDQRPKVEEYETELFLILKFLKYNEVSLEVETEQISLVLGKNYVISFVENPCNALEIIRNRIRTSKGTIRSKGADYLMYAIIDVIVDNYYTTIEDIGDSIEDMEEKLFVDPESVALKLIQNNKMNLLILRKSIYPLRESITKLYNDEHLLISANTTKYFRDVYDHTIQIIETIENYRDINLGLKDIYLSSISLKMNQVMKVLTIISTIFIPLTFIV